MKQKLLLICVALLCTVGTWAYTSVVPQVGRSYYLRNIGNGAYFKGTSTSYSATNNIEEATPVIIEASGSKFKLAFLDGGTTYKIYQRKGVGDEDNTSGVDFSFDGSATDTYGYRLTSKNGDYGEPDRYMTWNGTYLEFKKDHYDNIRDWQFISVYEVDATTASQCATTAEANYVTSANGWERVSNNTVLDESVNDYFFAIVSANYPGIMVNMANGNASQQASEGYTTSKSMWYSNSANPEANNSFLWMIEKCNESGYEGYTFRNASYPSLTIQAESGKSYFAHTHDQPNPCRWSSYALTPTDGVFTIKTLANGGTNYLGLWTPSNDYTNGQELAGNKNDIEKGSFLIYRIPRYKLDMTSRITNPSFETDDDGHVGATGWTLGSTNNDTKVHLNSNPTYTMSNVDGDKLFNTWDGDGTGYTISQTLSNMPAGVYKLTAVMGAFEGQTLQLIANDVTGTAPSEGKGTGVKVTTYVTLASPGNLAIQAKTAASAFYKVDNFRLTYIASSLTEDLTAASGIMNAVVNTAQQNAVSTYNDNKTIENYIDAMDAIAAAVESIDIYSTISGIMTTYQDKADALDAAGQAAYTSAINTATTGAASKYNDGTYTTAAEAETAFTADYRTAVKAQVTAGSDMTDAIINPSFETGNISPWTSADGGGVASNNNWSSGKVGTYFVERWQTSASGGLSDGTLTQTLTGMPAGRYTLTANAQNIEQQNASAHGTGYFLTLGSAQTEVTSEILTTVTFDLAEAGNLTIGMKLESCTGNWVSCDNFRLTYVGVQKNVTVAAKAGKYGTVIFPFTPDVSTGFDDIKFYSCASVNNGYTQIVEVSTPEANTPYIIKNNGGSDFSKTISGFSVAEESSYTVGLLTGIYTDDNIPMSDASNSYYVLQTKGDVQAFYKVEDADFPGTPYKCYLTIPAATPVKAFLFPDDPTAINAIETAENENTEIYNLAGQRLSKAQKGVNIINGKKVLVK